MSILPIYTFNHPVLRKKAKPVREIDDDLRRAAADMFDTMHNAGGVGLAANQVGLLRRLIVLDISDADDENQFRPIAMLNPEIVGEEGALTVEEGCLSLPGIREEVDRPETVRVRYHDLDLGPQEMQASGLLARAIQHEIDHINGVLFIDRLTLIRQKLLRGRLNKIVKGEVDVSYPIVGGSESREPRTAAPASHVSGRTVSAAK